MHHPREIVADTANQAAPSRKDGSHQTPAGGDWLGDALGQMTGQIRQRLADVEAKHATSLAEMEDRIARLSQAAHRARPDLPADLSTAFGRLEDGMNDLVRHIVEAKRNSADNGRFVFAERRSDDTRFVTERPQIAFVGKPAAAVLNSASISPADGGWDPQSAEALMQLYESGATGVSPAAMHSVHADSSLGPAVPRFMFAAQPAGTIATGLGEDRRWIEERFTKVTSDIESALADARPDAAINRLLARVDSFETRFESALTSVEAEVATVAKTTHIRQLESQIGDIGKQMVTVRQQLERLASVETQLQELVAIAEAAQQHEPENFAAPAQPALSQLDADTLASSVADLAANRLSTLIDTAEAKHVAMLADRDNATGQLLRNYVEERRRTDTVTNGMLDTMQEALVRLIDRVEAIDTAQIQSKGTFGASAASDATAMQSAATAYVAEHPMDAVATDVEQEHTFARRPANSVAPTAPTGRRTPRIHVETATDPNSSSVTDQASARPVISGSRKSTLPADAEPATADSSSDDATVVKRKKPVKREASTSSLGRRGIMISMIALLLVGISYIANLFLANRYGSMMPASIGSSQSETPRSPPAAATTPVVPSKSPSATKPEGATERSLSPGMTIETPRVPATERRSESESQKSSSGSVPRSVPETVTDDLSAAEPEVSNRLAAANPANVRPSAPGISLDTSSGPLRPNEVAALVRRSQGIAPQDQPGVAIISRAGGGSPSAAFNNFNRPTGQTGAEAERLQPAGKAKTITISEKPRQSAGIGAGIVTGATNGAQAISLGRGPDAPETSGTPADADSSRSTHANAMPPATVGPMTLRMAAAQGDPSATFEVGTRYAEGRGIKQDFAEAINWYQRSAAKGFPLAQYRLGTLYERGLGAPVDSARARIWYKRAADQGNVKAMHNMAVLSASKDAGGPDYAEASRWFIAAADRGLTDSQFNLGVLYENGLGVGKDLRQAYKWYALAARGSDKEAARRRDALVAALDSEIIRAAEADVAAWRSRGTDRGANDARFAGDEWRSRATARPAAMPDGDTTTKMPSPPQPPGTPHPGTGN